MREPKSLVLPLHYRVGVAEDDRGSTREFSTFFGGGVGDAVGERGETAAAKAAG
jgi:hypothetical protein